MNEKHLADCVLAYDEAIRQCANDPRLMSTFCTATGATLDTLYEQMVEAAKEVRTMRKALDDMARLSQEWRRP
jgi:hypothetical protein